MILGFDTETSGLMRDRLPYDAPEQPHLLQLSAQLVSEQRKRIARMTAIIRPNGWAIEAEAEKVHGISERVASRAGVTPLAALLLFKEMALNARQIVAHHAQFDWYMVANEIKRAGANTAWWDAARPKLGCTMERSTGVLKLQGEFGEKFPSLEEAHTALVGPYTSTHDAEEDVEACLRIWWALDERDGAKHDAA